MLCVVALAALAGRTEPATAAKNSAFVPPSLLAAAEASPDELFDVIVQGTESTRSHDVSTQVTEARTEEPGKGTRKGKGLKRMFSSISGTSAQLTGKQIVRLAKKKLVFSITPDARTGATYSNSQMWVDATEVLENSTNSWTGPYSFPTIAIVDSGVQARSDFGSRLRTQVSFVSSGPNSPGDSFGHGTMVAGIAAGSAEGYTGMSPKSDIVSLDVLDDNGAGTVGDLIAACDWILANKAQYNIRVANFSLNAGSGSSILYDPLNAAVEKLWLNGVVVVAAAGNYGVSASTPTGVQFAPANDPFVITVGASDINNSVEQLERLRSALVGLGLYLRRLLQARSLGPRSPHDRAGPRHVEARHDVPLAQVGIGLHVDVRHLVRGAGGLGRGRVLPGQVPELDAGPGQGRDVPRRRPPLRLRRAGLTRPRCARRGRLRGDEQPAEPERGALLVRVHERGDRAQDLRRGELVERRGSERELGERVVELGLLELRLVVERLVGERVVELGLLGERFLELGLVGERLLELGLVGELDRRRVAPRGLPTVRPARRPGAHAVAAPDRARHHPGG